MITNAENSHPNGPPRPESPVSFYFHKSDENFEVVGIPSSTAVILC